MKKKENPKRYKRRKSVGKRIIRMLILTVLIIFALSAYLNFSFLKYVVLGLFTMNGTNVAAGAKVIAEAPDGLTEYVEDIMQTYHDLPEEIRQDPDSDAYRDAFLKFHEYAYYQDVMGQLAEMEKNVVISNVYLQAYDPETETMVCLLDPTGATSDQEDPIFGEPMPVGYWESVTAEELEQLKASAAEDAADLSVGQDREIRTKESGSKDIGKVIIVARQLEKSGCPYMIFSMADIYVVVVNIAAGIYCVVYVIVLAVLVLIIYLIARSRIRKRVVRPIRDIANTAEKYANSRAEGQGGGSYFEGLHLKTGDELQELSEVMRSMEKDIASYEKALVTAATEKERMHTELSVATGIQKNMLPGIFPPFPDRHEFDLYASMDPAKEVGGDFYDFFMIDKDHLGLVIADVSGKGIPAALFMMSSMIIIKDLALQGYGPAKLLAAANERICEKNTMEMFVTVWFGILDLAGGVVTAANAGHEYPIIRQAGGEYELLRDKHGFVIGGMEGVKYSEYTFTLEPGGALFVYTDGLAEANNAQEQQYGTERLLATLNGAKDADARQTLSAVRADVDRFVGDAEQFDDLTMLCIIYHG